MKQQNRPKTGQWVRIHAKVTDDRVAPEEIAVAVRSKTGPTTVAVHLDAVIDVVPAPWPDEPGNMAVVLVDDAAYQRRDNFSNRPVDHRWYAAGSAIGADWATLVRDCWESGEDRPTVVSEP